MNLTKLDLGISLVDNSHIGILLRVSFYVEMQLIARAWLYAISFHHMNWNSVYTLYGTH